MESQEPHCIHSEIVMTYKQPPHPQTPAESPSVEVHLCVPQHEVHLLPKRRRAPFHIPYGAPLPRHGEVVYLSDTSAWGVQLVVHSWRAADLLRIEVWLEHVSSIRSPRPTGFTLTQ